MTEISYSGYRFPPEIIQQAIWLDVTMPGGRARRGRRRLGLLNNGSLGAAAGNQPKYGKPSNK